MAEQRFKHKSLHFHASQLEVLSMALFSINNKPNKHRNYEYTHINTYLCIEKVREETILLAVFISEKQDWRRKEFPFLLFRIYCLTLKRACTTFIICNQKNCRTSWYLLLSAHIPMEQHYQPGRVLPLSFYKRKTRFRKK